MRRASAIMLLVLTTVAGEAAAQPVIDEPVDETMSEEATELYREAREARMKDDFARCHARAKAAWALMPKNTIGALRGDCAVEIGRDVEAATFLEHYFADPSPTAAADITAYLEKQRAKALSHVARVVVTTNVEGAEVLVDGALPERYGLPIEAVYLDPGQHTFRAEHAGHAPAEQTLALSAGSDQKVSLALVPVAAPVPQPPSEPKDAASPLPWIFGGTLAAGLVVGAIGTAALVSSSNAGDDGDTLLNQLRNERGEGPCRTAGPPCGELAEKRKQQGDDLAIGAPLLAVGGSLVLASAVGLLVVTIDGDDGTRAVSFRVAPSGTGFTVFGQF